MKSLVVESRRRSTVSFVVVNQFQCLELLKRPDVALYHRDVPWWLREWKPSTQFDPEQDRALAAIPPPPPALVPDALLRIKMPLTFAPGEARRTFTWLATEYGIIEDKDVTDGRPVGDVLRRLNPQIITCSHSSKEGAVRSGASPDRVHVVHLGADTDIFRPLSVEERAAKRREFGWTDKFILFNNGSMWWKKGVFHILRALALFGDRHPHVRLVLKGSDELIDHQQMLDQALAFVPPDQRAKVAARIECTGKAMTNRELAAYYQAADAYVSPYMAEGFNLPVLEAAACGIPVVCTQGGPTDEFTTPDFALPVASMVVDNHPEIIRTCGAGARIRVPYLDELARQMERAITDAAFRARAAEAGPAHVRQHFTWKHTVDRLVQVLFHD